jgi:hypothetical protein
MFKAQKLVTLNTCSILRQYISGEFHLFGDETQNSWPHHLTMFPAWHTVQYPLTQPPRGNVVKWPILWVLNNTWHKLRSLIIIIRERDTTNVEHEICDYTGNEWSHRKGNKRLKRNLEAIRGNHSIDSLQKAAILGTSHIIRKVLQCEAWSLGGGDRRWFKRSTRERKGQWQETTKW